MFNCCMPNYNMFMGGCCGGNSIMNTMFKMQMFKMIMNNIFHPNQQSVAQPVMPMIPQMPVMPMTSMMPIYPSIFSNIQPSLYYYNNNTYSDSYEDTNLIDVFKNAYNAIFKKKAKDEDEVDDTDKSDKTNKTDKTDKKKKTKKAKRSDITYDKSFKNNGKLGKDFLDRVKKMAKNLNCDYRDLLAVINCESSFNTKAKNPGGAVGLTQFTDVAIADLKRVHGIVVTKEQILNMSALEQLDLAEKYLLIAKSYSFDKNARLSADDLYALNFLPGRANREVLCEKGERGKDGKLLGYYEGHGNSGLDKNKDNKITKSELGERVRNKYVDESLFA